MKVINHIKIEPDKIIKDILDGKIFIYPTDTIYGIGCNAENISSVNKIKSIKKRESSKPLSIIAPNLNWIKENLIVNIDLKKYLPGPYTLILKKKSKDFLNHVSNTDSIGVRIPNNFFAKIIEKSNTPFITTSVNLSGEDFLTDPKRIKEEIKDNVDILIDFGILTGIPSKIILDGKEIIRQV